MKRLFISALFVTTSLVSFGQVFKTSAEGGLSLISSYRQLTSETNGQTISLRDSREVPLTTYGVWAGFNYYINKRVFANAGLRFMRLGYRWELDISLIDFPPPGPALVRIDIYDIYNVASLPVSAGYSFISREKFSMHFGGGIVVDGIVGTYTKSHKLYADNSTKSERNPNNGFNQKPFNISYNLSLSSFIKLNPQSGLKAELIYYRNINAFNSDPVQLRLYASMLNVGYVYNINLNETQN